MSARIFLINLMLAVSALPAWAAGAEDFSCQQSGSSNKIFVRIDPDSNSAKAWWGVVTPEHVLWYPAKITDDEVRWSVLQRSFIYAMPENERAEHNYVETYSLIRATGVLSASGGSHPISYACVKAKPDL